VYLERADPGANRARKSFVGLPSPEEELSKNDRGKGRGEKRRGRGKRSLLCNSKEHDSAVRGRRRNCSETSA